jgi:hypothetical protein
VNTATAATVLAAALAQAAQGRRGEPTCFHPADQTRGWKKAAIPSTAIVLSAPASVPQLRLGGEVRTISNDSPRVFVENASEHGKDRLHFALDKGTYALKLQFAEGLKGAMVDVVARTATGTTHPLWKERRTRDSTLDITWEVTRVSSIDVFVHSHLREQPNLVHWTTWRSIKVSEDAQGLPGFQEPGLLYYFNEGGKDISLCERETTPAAFDNDLLAGANPISVTID